MNGGIGIMEIGYHYRRERKSIKICLIKKRLAILKYGADGQQVNGRRNLMFNVFDFFRFN